MTIGERLKALRKERGYSQEDVAKMLGIGRTTYLKYESGENKPSRKLKELASLFGVTTDYLLGRDTSAAPAPAEPHSGLTAREERDIERRLDAIMNDLAPGTGLAFYDGKELTEKERDLLRISLKNSMELVRSMAKERFTPKKYKK